MDKLFAVYKRELRSFFNSPIAYGAILFFLIPAAIVFLFVIGDGGFLNTGAATLRGYFFSFPYIFMVLIPAITMRLWADERRQGSAELLLTLPVKIGHLVTGKYLAALTVGALMLALTIPLSIMAMTLGNFEAGEVVGQYLGSLLLLSAATAIGVLVSSLTTNSISSFLLGLVFLLVLTISNPLAQMAHLEGPLASVLGFISLEHRFDSFQKGVIDSRDVGFYLLLTAAALWANTKILIFRKWR